MNLDYSLFFLRFKHPFGVSSNTRVETPSIFVKLTVGEHSGYGECCLPLYLGETIEGSVAFFEKVKPILKKVKDDFSVVEIIKTIGSLSERDNAAKAGIDIALHDLKAKIQGVSCTKLLGLAKPEPLYTSFTLGIDTEEVMVEKVKEASDFSILKIKAGTQNDRALIHLIRKYTDKALYVDVNQGWKDKHQALDLAHFMFEQNVVLLEQPMPVDMKEEMAWLTERSPIPTIADESVKRLKDLDVMDGIFSGINIKLMKSTGLNEALKMIELAREKKLKIMLGCMAESSCGTAAMAQLTTYADYIDLDAPLLYKNDPFSGVTYEAGRISANETIGTGAEPLMELFEKTI